LVRYKLTIEYDGTLYFGWQAQLQQKTIQDTIEEAIRKFSGETVKLYAAGRTDTGVHAKGQVAHFDMRDKFPEWQVRDAINFHLQAEQIVILKAEVVDETFHARFSAIQRIYQYKILNRPARSALDANRMWHIRHSLDLESMHQALSLLEGYHDFSSFRSSGCQATSPEITVDALSIDAQGDYITIQIKARSFLYHMVRNIIGSVAQVGTGKITVGEFSNIFASKNRALAGPMAPASGLYFTQVVYMSYSSS
jgi:tRNA pseudouridine38-40 synthase